MNTDKRKKKKKKIKAWLSLCDTEPPYVQMKKPTKQEIENCKKFDVKVFPCEITYFVTSQL